MQLTYEQAGRLVATSAAEVHRAADDVVTIPVFGLMTGSAISLTLWAGLLWAVWSVWTVIS